MLPIFGATVAYLHAAGREDIDVRMLGDGRPFIIEFENPKKSISCHEHVNDKNLRALMNTDLVICHDFKIVSR